MVDDPRLPADFEQRVVTRPVRAAGACSGSGSPARRVHGPSGAVARRVADGVRVVVVVAARVEEVVAAVVLPHRRALDDAALPRRVVPLDRSARRRRVAARRRRGAAPRSASACPPSCRRSSSRDRAPSSSRNGTRVDGAAERASGRRAARRTSTNGPSGARAVARPTHCARRVVEDVASRPCVAAPPAPTSRRCSPSGRRCGSASGPRRQCTRSFDVSRLHLLAVPVRRVGVVRSRRASARTGRESRRSRPDS